MFAWGRSPKEVVDLSSAFLAERELGGFDTFSDVSCGLPVEDLRFQPECPPGVSPSEFYARAGGLVAKIVDFEYVPVNLAAYLNDPALDDPSTIPSDAFRILYGATPKDDPEAAIIALRLQRYELVPQHLRLVAAQMGGAYFAGQERPYFVTTRLMVVGDIYSMPARKLVDNRRPVIEVSFTPDHSERRRVLRPDQYGKTPEERFDALCVQDDYFGWLALLAQWYKVPTFPDAFQPQDW